MTSITPILNITKNVLADNLSLASIDRNSLLRIGRSERVESFSEMERKLSFVVDRDVINLGTGSVDLSYVYWMVFLSSADKKDLWMAGNLPFSNFTFPFRFAITTQVSEDFLYSQGEEALFRLLEAYVESHEAWLLHVFLATFSYYVGVAVDFRDAYARITAGYLDLEPGTNIIYYSVPTPLLYGTLYESTTASGPRTGGGNATASWQWFQLDSALGIERRLVKVPMDYLAYTHVSGVMLVAYGDYLTNTFNRYYFDRREVDRVTESSSDENRYRLVFERYSTFDLTMIRNQSGATLSGSTSIAPAVSVRIISASDAMPTAYDMTAYLNDLNKIG